MPLLILRQTETEGWKVHNHDSWSLPLDLRTKRAPASKGFGGLVPSSMGWERSASISSSSLPLHTKSNAQYLICILQISDSNLYGYRKMKRVRWSWRLVKVWIHPVKVQVHTWETGILIKKFNQGASSQMECPLFPSQFWSIQWTSLQAKTKAVEVRQT